MTVVFNIHLIFFIATYYLFLSFQNTMGRDHNRKRFECDVCGMETNYSNSLVRHLEVEHLGGQYRRPEPAIEDIIDFIIYHGQQGNITPREMTAVLLIIGRLREKVEAGWMDRWK